MVLFIGFHFTYNFIYFKMLLFLELVKILFSGFLWFGTVLMLLQVLISWKDWF